MPTIRGRKYPEYRRIYADNGHNTIFERKSTRENANAKQIRLKNSTRYDPKNGRKPKLQAGAGKLAGWWKCWNAEEDAASAVCCRIKQKIKSHSCRREVIHGRTAACRARARTQRHTHTVREKEIHIRRTHTRTRTRALASRNSRSTVLCSALFRAHSSYVHARAMEKEWRIVSIRLRKPKLFGNGKVRLVQCTFHREFGTRNSQRFKGLFSVLFFPFFL